jgi:hypothetical protein
MNRTFVRAALAFGVVAAATLVVPAVAAYAVPGQYRVSAVSPNNIVSPKNVTATCNAGDRLIGAGGRINGGGGEVVLARIIPNVGLTAVTVHGIEHTMQFVGWEVEAFAICDPNPPANLTRVAFSTALNNVNGKTAVANCPAGRALYGGGYELADGFGQVFPDDVRPSLAANSMTITAFDDPGFAGNWGVTSYAICGNPPPNGNSLQIHVSASNTVSPKTESTPACPFGQALTGLGGEITGALGEVTITDLTPDPSMTAAIATGNENGPFGGPWTTTVYAICA